MRRWHADLPLMEQRWKTRYYNHKYGRRWGSFSSFWVHETERLDPEHGHPGHSKHYVPATPDVEAQTARSWMATLAGEWPKPDWYAELNPSKVTMLYPKIIGYGNFRKSKIFGSGCRRCCRRDRDDAYQRARERRAARREYNAA